MKSAVAICKPLLFTISILLSGICFAQGGNIKNDVFWNTQDGKPLYSQGGGIFKFTDPASGIQKYYWYGVHYKQAELYRNNPDVTYKEDNFEAVTCYTSTDLVHWDFEANALTKAAVQYDANPTWLGRLGVAYVSPLKKYAMFIQHGKQVLIAVADNPAGPFEWHQEIDMQPLIGTPNTGDQTVFTDQDTGKSYLIYSYGNGRNKIYVSEIGVKNGMVNILDCTKVFEGQSREGNCLFKYGGKYYMVASNIYGWDSSHVYYLIADDIRGPYTPANDMLIMDGASKDYAHISQTGFFYSLKGSKKETVLYCGDRWADFAGNGLGYNVWVPLSFEGTTPYFNSLSSWSLNAITGEWQVAPDNNYVMNGSFEADRNKIPSDFKPVQEQLLGWQTTVIKGNAIAVRSSDSPVLNYFNTQQDRQEVIGEKSLYISDTIDFERKVTQTITSSPTLPLPDGLYTLTARVKNTSGFTILKMYAGANKKRPETKVTAQNAAWSTITLPNIRVTGGQIEIGFIARGKAGAYCIIDDVVLLKQK